MDNQIKKCEKCEEMLKPSQYLRLEKEGEPIIREEENLVCRNYPKCEKAEKEFDVK